MALGRFIKQDNTAYARLQTSRVICMEKFQEFPAMARFTLRDEGIALNIVHLCLLLVHLSVCLLLVQSIFSMSTMYQLFFCVCIVMVSS